MYVSKLDQGYAREIDRNSSIRICVCVRSLAFLYNIYKTFYLIFYDVCTEFQIVLIVMFYILTAY